MLDSVLVFYILNLISLVFCLLLIVLLATKSKNRIIIAICLIASTVHIICLANWIFFGGDPVRLTAHQAFCWFQSISLPYLALVIHCLVLCTVLELWIVLRGSCNTIKQVQIIEAEQAKSQKTWDVPSLERPSTYYYSSTSPIISPKLVSLLKFLRSWKGFSVSFLLPLLATAATVIALSLSPHRRVESSHTMCMVVSPRWIVLIGFCVLAIILMLPLVILSVHLVYIIFYARKHGSNILLQHSITLSVCIRMIIFSLGITLISCIVDVWTLVDVVSEPYERFIDSSRDISADMHDYTVATLGIVLFLIFGTSYDIARLYVNPIRVLFGYEKLPSTNYLR